MSCAAKGLVVLMSWLIINIPPSIAATVTGSLPVVAGVLSVCALGNIVSVTFGSYDPTLSSPTNTMGSIAVQCTNGTAYSIGLNAGTGSGATVTNRLMTRAPTPGTLAYALYQDSARTLNWGNTSGNMVTGTGTGLAIISPVYGRIAPLQSAVAGNYADTVTITVTF